VAGEAVWARKKGRRPERRTVLATAAVCALILAPSVLHAADPALDFSAPEPGEELSAGAATSRKSANKDAFSHPSANMAFNRRLDFTVGNGVFRKLWVSAPASTTSSDGLGPLYNARACQRCHLKDGRGHPPAGPDDSAVSKFLRLSVPPASARDREALANHRANVIPEPAYGGQLQDLAIPGHVAEGRMVIDYEEIPVELAGARSWSCAGPATASRTSPTGPCIPRSCKARAWRRR
jgi:CxxC motif-containing protein (DUF1111 family)